MKEVLNTSGLHSNFYMSDRRLKTKDEIVNVHPAQGLDLVVYIKQIILILMGLHHQNYYQIFWLKNWKISFIQRKVQVMDSYFASYYLSIEDQKK